MAKNILIFGAAFTVFSIGGLFLGTSAHAEEVDCVVGPTNAACIVNTSDEVNTTPIAEPVDDYPVFDENEVVENDVLFAGEDSDGDLEITDEEVVEEEPALWPMYLSLGMLGLAVLVFIVLNIFSPRLKK